MDEDFRREIKEDYENGCKSSDKVCVKEVGALVRVGFDKWGQGIGSGLSLHLSSIL